MKVKVIDLLNKIANGEEVPEKIKYKDKIYTYYGQEYRIDLGIMGTHTLLYDVLCKSGNWYTITLFKEEVEIIEEQQDIDIQAIEEIKFRESDKEHLGFGVDLAHSKINELVQAVKQLDKNIKDKE